MAEIRRHRNGHALYGRSYTQFDHRAGVEVLQPELALVDYFQRLQTW
jgi:hypothetical protein